MRTKQLFGDDLALEQHGIHSECQLYVDVEKNWKVVRDTYSMKMNASRIFEVLRTYLVSDKATKV